MAFEEVRDAIKTLLEAVDGVGEVHDYVRHTVFWDEYFRDHVDAGKINTWEITRRAAAQEITNVQGATATEPYFDDTHSVVIIGRVVLNDAKKSEQEFQAVIDRIVAAVRLDTLLGGVVLKPRSAQVPLIEHRMFGGVLAHYVEITFEAIERVGG